MARFWSNVGAGTISGIVSGVVGGFILTGALVWSAPWVSDRVLAARPTCAEPEGLRPVTREEISEITGRSEPEPSGAASYEAASAFDSVGGTLWVPDLMNDPEAKRPQKPTLPRDVGAALSVRLKNSSDIRLVCVVNGLANAFDRYENWARVRTLKVWASDDADSGKVTVLQSLGSETFPNAQFAARDLGETDVVRIQLLDSYVGLIVRSFDPDMCLRDGARVPAPKLQYLGQPAFDQGCYVNPKAITGLAEVYLYVPEGDEQVPSSAARP